MPVVSVSVPAAPPIRVIATWDVEMPPIKRQAFHEHFVPTAGALRQFMVKKRRLVIEIHSKATARNSPPHSSGKSATTNTEELSNHDAVVLRVLRKAKEADDNDSSVVMNQNGDDISDLGLYGTEDSITTPESWVEHSRYRLDDVHIRKIRHKTVEVRLLNDSIARDLKFRSDQEANSFSETMERMRRLEQKRGQRQLAAYRQKHASTTTEDSKIRSFFAGSASVDSSEPIQLLIEIVSGTDLPVADLKSSDPYVVVHFGGKEVHRTGVKSKTLDPIWTLTSGSLFYLSVGVDEFFNSSSGMTFSVKDYDALGSNETLGHVTVSLDQLLKGEGQRQAFDVIPDKPPKKKPKHPPLLYLRIRPATPEDVQFMDNYRQQSTKKGVHNDETYLPPRSQSGMNLLKRHTKKEVHSDHVEKLRRTKPFPDPERVAETKWMSDDDIEAEAYEPSTHWVEASSGTLGKLYVEVLGCDDLPNLDSASLNISDKTDCFACLCFEDAVVNTDVIPNALCPRWMPWCRRAFAFNVSNPSSKVFIALFDYDNEYSPLQMASRAAADLHDPIARVTLQASRFYPNTVYTLAFPLYKGELAKHRTSTRGKLYLRVRLEWQNMQKAMASTLAPPKTDFVSLARSIDFQLAHFTAEGRHDFNKWSMETFTGHIEELQSYEIVIDYLTAAAMTVVFWRGHHPVTLCRKKILIPGHSMIAFTWACLIAWNFNLFFSFIFFAVGWAMIACNKHVRSNPSPWHQCASYGKLWLLLFFGKAPAEKIPAHKNEAEFGEYMDAYQHKMGKRELEKKLEAKFDTEIRRELGNDVVDGEADTDITSKKSGGVLSALNIGNVNPLKPILHPIQIELGKIVILARIVKSIVLWRETYYAFWLTTFSLVASFVSVWVPWGFLLRWTLRVALVGLLGPWMAVVDHKFFKENPDPSNAERDEKIRARVRARYGAMVEAAATRQVNKERQLKLKTMKKYLYGKYIVRIPMFNEDLFSDLPLPESYSEAYKPLEHGVVHISERKYGQRLVGDMIPQRQIQEAALAAKTTKHQSIKKLWKKSVPRRHRKKSSRDEKTPLLADVAQAAYDARNDMV